MFGKKVNKTRVFPVTIKIVITFTLFILISNFTTNYINLSENRTEQFKLMNELLTKDLKNIYQYCNNQYEIYQYDQNLEGSFESIQKRGLHTLNNEKSVILGFNKSGQMVFQASKMYEDSDVERSLKFTDQDVLKDLNEKLKNNKDEGKTKTFTFNDEQYFGVYKYNDKWNLYIVRAEELDEFYSASRTTFVKVGAIIIFITLLTAIVGIFLLRYFLRFINIMSKSIMKMVNEQQIDLIDLQDATNDDITYLGTAFNSLSSTVGNLVTIFRKFANQDIAHKAYTDREVKLEGTRKELTILFSDIKSFTFITETLGTDIIKLLNLHYDSAIREVVKLDGIIGSIIGDALLAVFGALDDHDQNKSFQAVQAGYKLHDVTQLLRNRMKEIKDGIQNVQGGLTKAEAKVYKAVLLEIGVGIDGGEVFYGTLGSYVRMTSTVIGDNVNAASRLEGLTRVYKVPVICSDYVKKDIEDNVEEHGFIFVELDTVLVKGKTKGKKVYWPIKENDYTARLQKQISYFEAGLKLYYAGDWKLANKSFKSCKLPLAEEFKERTKQPRPRGWNGIWEMKTK